MKQASTEETEMCGFCNGTGQADESTIDGWAKVPCPTCRPDETKTKTAADFRAEIEQIKAAIGVPAWR